MKPEEYQKKFKEVGVGQNPEYPLCNDIATAQLFYDLHKRFIVYVSEERVWYCFNGKQWVVDNGNNNVSEICKNFILALINYAKQLKKALPETEKSNDDGNDNTEDFEKYVKGFLKYSRRKELIIDTASIAPKSITEFDTNQFLFNCLNGTFDLINGKLNEHNPEDYITKISRVEYKKEIICNEWIRFINEIMCGDIDTIKFLKTSLGYALSGDTSQECFWICYGPTTRNGKSTLINAIAYLLGDYATTIQPQTFAKRSTNGAASSADLAKLQGVRLVNMPEPDKGLELNAALVKQITGGDSITARYLFKNFTEFKPEFKLFINTNHIPKINDRTIFASKRLKIIPFNRHFKPEEQQPNLKQAFRESNAMSSIFNWLFEGFTIYQKNQGFIISKEAETEFKYFQEDATAAIDEFLKEYLVEVKGERVKTSEIYKRHYEWARTRDFKPMTTQAFVGELRTRYNVKRNNAEGNILEGFILKQAP